MTRKCKNNMEKKKSSYRRMKERHEAKIAELTSDIVALVENEDIEKEMAVRIKWRTKLMIERMIWHDNPEM